MSVRTGVILFRRDLRLSDNPALTHASERCDAIIPLYIWSPSELKPWAPGAASRYWLHQSLQSLDSTLRALGSRLVLARGDSTEVILDVAQSSGTSLVCWNRRYEPNAIAADSKLKHELSAHGIETKSFNGSLLVEPWDIQNKAGKPFRLFTPFWKTCQSSARIKPPLATVSSIPAPPDWPASLRLDDLRLEPTSDWTEGVRGTWRFGEHGAESTLETFLDEGISHYKEGRDHLGERGISHLSPYLASGELSPRQVWDAVQKSVTVGMGNENEAEAFLRQLFWREFAYHLIYHEPQTTNAPLRPEFERFPWRVDREALKRWQRGLTGFPIVDAGMRELWHTGYMHNRARMVVASFLVKDLLIPWLDGAKWFWDTLVDADLANNTMGWQWVAGCGADAAPYFRVFNPVLQGERFDKTGAYVRTWVPELADLPNKYIHRPWEAPEETRNDAGVILGDSYPEPIVDHREARIAALAAFDSVRH